MSSTPAVDGREAAGDTLIEGNRGPTNGSLRAHAEALNSPLLSPDGDERIKARLEACRQGILQLDILRSKHKKLMEEMRVRLPTIPGEDSVRSRVKKSIDGENEEGHRERESVQSDISCLSSISTQIREELISRCDSPLSGCVSHRSSVSIDSGCVSIASNDVNSILPPTLSYGAFRKQSMEDHCGTVIVPALNRRERDQIDRALGLEDTQINQQKITSDDFQIVATTIQSTTSLRPRSRKAGRTVIIRPRSMYTDTEEHKERLDEFAAVRNTRRLSPQPTSPMTSPINNHSLDVSSFSAITPPPIHRKFGLAQGTDIELQKNTSSALACPSPTSTALNASSNRSISTCSTPKVSPTMIRSVRLTPVHRTTSSVSKASLTCTTSSGNVRPSFPTANLPKTPPVPTPRRNVPYPQYNSKVGVVSPPVSQARREIVKPLRTAQKPDFIPSERIFTNSPSVFHAARIFVDHSTEKSPQFYHREKRSSNRGRGRPQSMFEKPIDEELVYAAQPALILSRQPSCGTPPTGSPSNNRKVNVAAGIARFEAQCRLQSKPPPSSRRVKKWHESEAL